jgi:cyanate lyase
MSSAHLTRDDVTAAVLAAKRSKQLTFTQLAEQLGKPKVWLTAALLGQHPFQPEDAARVGELLGLDDEQVVVLTEVPTRGSFSPTAPPTDPTMYRLYEVLQVYGPALKQLIHEEFGDGIMSAINFNLDLERRAHPGGDRVRITLDGKFLPYAWD